MGSNPSLLSASPRGSPPGSAWGAAEVCRLRHYPSSDASVKDPSPGPRPLEKTRGAVHPLPWERERISWGGAPRREVLSFSLGEKEGAPRLASCGAEVRSRMRGLFPASLRGPKLKAPGSAGGILTFMLSALSHSIIPTRPRQLRRRCG